MTGYPTVGDAMLRAPTVHPADLSVGAARAAFDASTHTHVLLLAERGKLVSSVTRADLEAGADPADRAARLGALRGRTIAPDASLAATHDLMLRRGIRRLAVVDDARKLLGLLCLKRSRSGFCTDDGVAAMRHERAMAARSR